MWFNTDWHWEWKENIVAKDSSSEYLVPFGSCMFWLREGGMRSHKLLVLCLQGRPRSSLSLYFCNLEASAGFEGVVSTQITIFSQNCPPSVLQRNRPSQIALISKYHFFSRFLRTVLTCFWRMILNIVVLLCAKNGGLMAFPWRRTSGCNQLVNTPESTGAESSDD